jgi:Pyridoxamine 5'-phosphate oxidase
LPQLSNIYHLIDPLTERVRFSITTDRVKGSNLLRDPRASLHVAGTDFFNFAVVAGRVSAAVARYADDGAVQKLYGIHVGLGATAE